MPKKFVFILEIIAIILASFYYILIEVIPDYKKNIGSSDKFINLENYENMLEFEIPNKINFAVIINKNKSIYQIIFLDENASCLYNKNIDLQKYKIFCTGFHSSPLRRTSIRLISV